MILLAGGSSIPPSADRINFKKWLSDEVYWLITPEEQKAFKKLKTDRDREKFVALFWAKRDPTPLTEENEFKEAYYANLAYVNQKYTRADEMGWKTEVGKVLLFFGLPRERQTNPETWIYDPIPALKIESEFEIVFDIVEGAGLVLNQHQTSRIALEAMDEYAARSILYPELKEVPDYGRQPAKDPQSLEKEILEKVSREGAGGEAISFELSAFFNKAEDKKTAVTLVYFFNPHEAGFQRAVLFGKATSRNGEAQFYRREVLLEKNKDWALVVLPLLPDQYEIVSVCKEGSSEKYGFIKKALDVPDYWNGALSLGSIIVSDQMESIVPGSGEYSAFNFNQYFASPKQHYRFHRSDTLSVAYQIYNAAVLEGRVQLVQEISLTSTGRTYRLPELPLEHELREGQAIVSGTPIPLASIESGEYDLLIKIRDRISHQEIEKTEKIIIED